MFIKKRDSRKVIRHYVSEIDQRLAEFNRTHPWSATQQAEIDKYQRIYKMRNHAIPQKKKPSIWDFE